MQTQNSLGTKADLAKYRLAKAKEEINDAVTLLKETSYASANNRIYYAMFHILLSIHALDERETRTHKTALGEFNRLYIRTNVFDKSYWKKIAQITEARHSSDYDDFYLPNESETKENLDFVQDFWEEVKMYCENRIGQEIRITSTSKMFKNNQLSR